MKFFGITERENETNNDTELALREFMRTKSTKKTFMRTKSTKKTFILTESTELLHAVHNQMAEVFNHLRHDLRMGFQGKGGL